MGMSGWGFLQELPFSRTSMSANKPSISGSSAFPVVIRSASCLRSAKSEREVGALRAGAREMPHFYNIHRVFCSCAASPPFLPPRSPPPCITSYSTEKA